MKLRCITLVLLVCGLFYCCDSIGFPGRAGDQPPRGECETFKWGGVSKLHWYACCNNCNDTDHSCDGKTYQTASTVKYCDSCGKDNIKGNGEPDSIFKCGGCSGQNDVQATCSSRLKKFYNIPGFCWAFAKCFKRQCRHHYGSKQSETPIPDSCYDLRCDPGEDVHNCPTDCCGTLKDQCNWANYQNDTKRCPPACCGESSCCGANGGQSIQLPLLSIIIIAGIQASIYSWTVMYTQP